MTLTTRYTRTINAQGLRLIVRLDGEALGTPPPPRDPQLGRARDLLRLAAEALRSPVAGRRAPPLVPRAPLPPELTGIDGAAVRRARERLRLSQRDLACELGSSRGALADMERGRRSVSERVAAWAHRVATPPPREGGEEAP